MMTEDEAGKKWCPFARVLRLGGGGPKGPFNRVEVIVESETPTYTGGSAPCIGSKCMAWRWMTEPGDTWSEFSDENGIRHVVPTPPSGYCGLAGTPYGAPE
jgi:hypothetical protein